MEVSACACASNEVVRAGGLFPGIHTFRHLWAGLHRHLCHLHSVAHARLLDGARWRYLPFLPGSLRTFMMNFSQCCMLSYARDVSNLGQARLARHQ